jgi:hypothetical protein
MAIDHDELKMMQTIERYLRGELTPEEEQEWEEHYFQCENCFEALQATAQLAEFFKTDAARQPAECGRAKSRSRPRLTARSIRDWLLPMPARQPALAWATATVLVGILAAAGWMRVATLRHEVRELRMPKTAILSYVLNEGVRGEEPSVKIPIDAGRFLLQFNLLSQQAESTLRTARIKDTYGDVVWTGTDMKGQGRYGTFVIACESSFFTPGDYELHVDEVRSEDGMIASHSVFPFRITETTSPGARP